MPDRWDEYLVIKLGKGRKCCIAFSGPSPDHGDIAKVCEVLRSMQYLDFDEPAQLMSRNA